MASYAPRRVRDEEERGAYSSDYIQLDEREKFVGYALFNGDPKSPEPGYYEYWEHYDPGLGKRGQSVPCATDGCPYCEDGEKPRVRAKSAWLITQMNDKVLASPEFRTFTMGPQVVRQFSELRNEGDKIKGRLFRVSRPAEREYLVAPKTEMIKADAIKEALKAVPDFEKGLSTALKRAMERHLMSKAMNDEDDSPATPDRDEDEPKPKAAAKGKGKAQEPETDEWPDTLDNVDVIVSEVDDSGNFFVAAHGDYDGTKNIYTTAGIDFDLSDLVEGQIVTVTAELDSDGDYILQAEPEVEASDEPVVADEPEAEADSELPDRIEGEPFAITAIDSAERTFSVENDELGLTFDLWFLSTGPGSDVDFDEYAIGDKIVVYAEKDVDNDLVSTNVPQKVTAKAKGRKPAAAKGK